MYYIFSYNSLNGFFTGAFAEPDSVFYAGPEWDGGRKWTGLISDAQGFATEKDANAFIEEHWGTRMNFGVLHMDPDYWVGDREDLAHRRFADYQRVSRMLASKTASARYLVEKSKEVYTTPTCGMTSREKWIIDVMQDKIERLERELMN